jgi:aspartyl/glutamyl-tRNA(Asn/Gln) amidotransferase C subunit
MPISLEEVQHVAKLARINLDEQELKEFQAELNALLGHFEDIQGAQVSSSDLTTHVLNLHSIWQEDVIEAGLMREEATRSAAVVRAGLYVVPTIIEE